MTIDDSEIVKFELQSAKKVWDALPEHERDRLMTMQAKRDPNKHDPQYDKLIELGLVFPCMRADPTQYTSMGGMHTQHWYSHIYDATPFGRIVIRYGVAIRVVETAQNA